MTRISFFILAVIIAGSTLFVPGFYSGFILDDYAVIADNPVVQQINSLYTIFTYDPSRFIAHVSFALNYCFHSMNSQGYHWVNLCIHIINTVLLFWFLNIIFKKSSALLQNEDCLLKSGFCVLVFLLHPLQTQSVLYISQRSTLFAGMFLLSALITFIKLREDFQARRYLLLWGLAVLGCMSKPTFVVLPFVAFVCDRYFLQKKEVDWRDRVRAYIPVLLPLLIIPCFLFLFNVRFLGVEGKTADLMLAFSATSDIMPIDYLLTQLKVISAYLKLFIVPIGQSVDHDVALVKNSFDGGVILSAAVLTALAGVCWLLRGKNKLISFGIILFFILMIPEGSVFPLPDFMFEHRMYLAVGSLAVVLVEAIYYLLKDKRLCCGAIAAMILIFTGFSSMRVVLWKNPDLLLYDAVSKAPAKARINHQLGIYYEHNQDLRAAELNYRESLRKDHNYLPGYVSLGNLLGEVRDYQRAANVYKQLLAIDPSHFTGHLNLGIVYMYMNQVEPAVLEFYKVLALKPNSDRAYYFLGRIHALGGQYKEAEAFYAKAIKINPVIYTYYYELGNVYLNQAQYDPALKAYQRALKFSPNNGDVHNTLGIVYANLGKYEQARAHFEKAVKFKKNPRPVYLNLAQFYSKRGQQEQADYYLRRAQMIVTERAGQ